MFRTSETELPLGLWVLQIPRLFLTHGSQP
nr:MAG TPA: hypothetical protein [Caudoviricetes sp.]